MTSSNGTDLLERQSRLCRVVFAASPYRLALAFSPTCNEVRSAAFGSSPRFYSMFKPPYPAKTPSGLAPDSALTGPLELGPAVVLEFEQHGLPRLRRPPFLELCAAQFKNHAPAICASLNHV